MMMGIINDHCDVDDFGGGCSGDFLIFDDDFFIFMSMTVMMM